MVQQFALSALDTEVSGLIPDKMNLGLELLCIGFSLGILDSTPELIPLLCY